MFKNWQNTLAAASAPTSKADPKSMSPTLRSDIYASLDQTKPWLVGATPRHAGDGVSYQPILTIIHKHFPDLTLGIESVGNVEAEVALVVAGITNMVLEMSKWDGMAGAMSMRTWVDVLSDAHARIDRHPAPGGPPGPTRREQVGRGITKGINQLTDVTLMTREFAARIQIISLLKSGKPIFAWCPLKVLMKRRDRDRTMRSGFREHCTIVNTKVHGTGSEEARQGEALWSSKFI